MTIKAVKQFSWNQALTLYFEPEHYHYGCQATLNGIKHLLPILSQDAGHDHQGNQAKFNVIKHSLPIGARMYAMAIKAAKQYMESRTHKLWSQDAGHGH